MESKAQNPLAKHFRQPAIYLKLPSNGQFWPESAINLPANGEIAIYPMTTRDEITLRTPDALMNGSGVVSVIQSCCPEIIDPWQMPSIDVDAVIIAIRIASYGHEMGLNSACPNCKEFNDYSVDLRYVLDNITMPDYSKYIEYESLRIKLCPQPYFSFNRSNQTQYEEQKLLQAIENSSMDELVRANEINKHMETIIDLGIETLSTSTEYISINGESKVIDKNFIKEFYENAPAALIKKIQEQLSDFNTKGAIKALNVSCQNCKHEFDLQLTFDYSSFFV
ncbi:hypothetical protein EBR43_12485 [bacterium]|nr:hypothetical protein [bacterium]